MIKFKCGWCNDNSTRSRKGLREHIREKHLRNEFFGIKWKTGEKGMRRNEIIREEFI